jgi:hypothetical protein
MGLAAITNENSMANVSTVNSCLEENGRYWRKAAIPDIGCARCGTCYEIEMISSS